MEDLNITLYSTGCPKCNVLKKKLEEADIGYVVNSDTGEMLRLGIQEVPVLCVGGKLMDFNEAIEWIRRR